MKHNKLSPERFLNVLIFRTIVSKMRTIIKSQMWDILDLFYHNKNAPLHLRGIAREINLREGSLTRHLNYLKEKRILKSQNEANLKKFYVNPLELPKIFPLFDIERFEKLPLIRKNAMTAYINKVENKPIFLILFGSTAKGTYTSSSDIDILEVSNKKSDNSKALKFVEAQTGMHISLFQIDFSHFIDELRLKKDHVVQAALETGYPVYNHLFFYGVMNNERA